MLRRFASIENPNEYGYAFDSEAYDVNAQVDSHFRMYQTYGDGLVQHSGDWSITREHFADYMLSLAAYMLKDDELAERMVYTLARGPKTADIEFCASVVFKPAEGCTAYEKKTRYFSVEEKKVTSNPQKQYDKRYEQVESRHDGRPEAIYSMLLPSYAGDLERYAWATAIHEWVNSQDGLYMQLPARFLAWTEDSDKAREIRDAFEAAKGVTEAYRLRCSAESAIANVQRRMERRASQAVAA